MSDKSISKIVENNGLHVGNENFFTIKYNITSVPSTVKIFNNYYSSSFNINQINKMYVDNEEINITSQYTFNKIGEHTIKCMFNCDELKSCYAMFSGHTSSVTINISELNTAKVTSMKEMFARCSATIIGLDKLNTSNVTDMSYMFSECSKLSSLDLSSFDTSNVTNMCCMFESCTNLTSLDLSSFDTSNVTNMSGMFYFACSLISIKIIGNISNVTSYSNMFGSITACGVGNNNGTFTYNCEYKEYWDKIFEVSNIPNGWIAICETV